MTGSCQQFLAGPGLALDQQRRVQRCHAPGLADHRSHDFRTLENTVEAAQFLLAHVVDALADLVGAMQGQHRAGHRLAVIVLRLQRRDIRQENVTLDLDPQAIDPRLVRAHQLRQVEIRRITRQRDTRHFVYPDPEQLRRRPIGRDNRATHVDGQHRKLQGPEQGVELHMPTLAGHQADALDAKDPGNGFELRPQGLELQVDQIRAVQVDGIALITADLAAGHVDAVVHQQVENVAKNADAVLAMHFDTHGKARKRAMAEAPRPRRSGHFFQYAAVSRKDYVTKTCWVATSKRLTH